jgi:hypothetical protein
MVSSLVNFGGIVSLSASVDAQTLEPITWNVMGLDSNKPATTQPAPGVYPPDRFPVGVEVCNTTLSDLLNHKAVFVWDETPDPNYLHLWDSTVNWNDADGTNNGEASTEQVIPTLAAGSCVDTYFWVQIEQIAAAYDFSRNFHVELWDDGSTPTDTATNGTKVAETAHTAPTLALAQERELYVEYLVSQNRNAVKGYVINGVTYPADGNATVPLALGQTFELTLLASTATQGYEQLEAFITLPPDVFSVTEVAATYSANAGTDPNASTRLYADGCGWINDPNEPGYLTSNGACTGVGKYGGTITKTYTVTVTDTLPANPVIGAQALIYDFSGSSFHYNADYDSSAIELRIYDPTDNTDINAPTGSEPTLPTFDVSILKTVSYNGGSDTGTWTVTVSRESPSTGLISGITVGDLLPRSYEIKNNATNSIDVSTGSVAYYSDDTDSAQNESPALDDGDAYLEWNFDLAEGVNSATMTIDFSPSGIVATTNEDLTNCANVLADQDSTNNESCVTIERTPAAAWDVGVQKSVVAVTQEANGTSVVTFEVAVSTLSGTNTAIDVIDTLPAGYTFQGLLSESGPLSFVSHTAGTVALSYASAPSPAQGAVRFTAIAALPSPTDTIETIEANYLNSVQLLSGGNPVNDLDTGNNQATAGYVPPLLDVEKTPSSLSVDDTTRSDVINYSLTVKKLGGFATGNTITLTENPPPGMEFIAITEEGGSTTWTCEDASGTLGTNGTLFTTPVGTQVICIRDVLDGELAQETYPTLTFAAQLDPVPVTDGARYENYVSVEGVDGVNPIPYTFADDSASVVYSATVLVPVSVSGTVFLDTLPSGGYDGLRTTEAGTDGGGLYACINTAPAQFAAVGSDGSFNFTSITPNSSYDIVLTTSSTGTTCPTESTLNANWYSTGESQDGVTTDSPVISKQTVSDGVLAIDVGSTDLSTITFGLVQGGIFDPPFGTKTGEFLNGQPVIRWTMVWINDSPIVVSDALITDAPPPGTTYATTLTTGTDSTGIVCTPAGSTVVDFCYFNIDEGRLEVQADFGPESGDPVTAAEAANELVITFDVVYDEANLLPVYENQASLEWDPGTGPLTSTTDDPTVTGASDPTTLSPPPAAPPATPVPTVPYLLLALFGILLAWRGSAAILNPRSDHA